VNELVIVMRNRDTARLNADTSDNADAAKLNTRNQRKGTEQAAKTMCAWYSAAAKHLAEQYLSPLLLHQRIELFH